MKFQFTRLGAIDEATIELAPLTVICGLNNTGKTYATYAIYALLSTWRQLIDWEVSRRREPGANPSLPKPSKPRTLYRMLLIQ